VPYIDTPDEISPAYWVDNCADVALRCASDGQVKRLVLALSPWCWHLPMQPIGVCYKLPLSISYELRTFGHVDVVLPPDDALTFKQIMCMPNGEAERRSLPVVMFHDALDQLALRSDTRSPREAAHLAGPQPVCNHANKRPSFISNTVGWIDYCPDCKQEV